MSRDESGDAPTGLYGKYEVTKNGKPVDRCFVLRPDDDPAARAALLAYAEATQDTALRGDLMAWVRNADLSAWSRRVQVGR